MTGKHNEKSKKHSNKSHKRDKREKDHTANNTDKYLNALRERHPEDDSSKQDDCRKKDISQDLKGDRRKDDNFRSKNDNFRSKDDNFRSNDASWDRKKDPVNGDKHRKEVPRDSKNNRVNDNSRRKKDVPPASKNYHPKDSNHRQGENSRDSKSDHRKSDVSRDADTRKNEHRNLDDSNSRSEKSKSSEKHRDTQKRRLSRERTEDRHSKRKKQTEESYEELSKEKKRIESELKALEEEEAAEKEAEKKSRRHASEHNKKKDNVAHIKEEPLSDDEQKKKAKPDRPPIQDRPVRSINYEDVKPRIKPSTSSAEEGGAWGIQKPDEDKDTPKPKDKPNFATSGKLAEDTNTYNGVVIKYNQPSEARKPKRRWRLYPFKGETDLPFIPIHRQSAYLFGRTRSIADIPIDHPSCSKQHAVLQFRLVSYKRDDGSSGRRVRPYIIDLESSNGTFVNNKRIDARCYVELLEKDVVKFGFSSREYVILHEESKDDEEDDDVND